MFKLRNQNSAARQALLPPPLAGHGLDGAKHTTSAAGCFPGMAAALRHVHGVQQTAAGHGGRWIALTRWAAGIIFLIFGIAKFSNHAAELASFRHYPLPAPNALVYLVGVIEIGGSLLLIAGLLTRLAALALAADMIGAIVVSGLGRGELVSLTLAPLLLVAMISLIRLGAGYWSLDRQIALKTASGHGRHPGDIRHRPIPGGQRADSQSPTR